MVHKANLSLLPQKAAKPRGGQRKGRAALDLSKGRTTGIKKRQSHHRKFKCSVSPREIHYTPTSMAKIKNSVNSKGWMQTNRITHMAGGNVKRFSHRLAVSYVMKCAITRQPSICPQRHICHRNKLMFTQKQPHEGCWQLYS